MANFARNVRYGLRLLLKNPSFTSVALLALVLGIGRTRHLQRGLRHSALPHALSQSGPACHCMSKIKGGRNGVSVATFSTGRGRALSFNPCAPGPAAISRSPAPISRDDSDSADHTGLQRHGRDSLFLERDFLPEEGQVGREHVVIMTHRLWMERFGSDRNISASPSASMESLTVVWVSWRRQPDRLESQLFVPLAFKPRTDHPRFSFYSSDGPPETRSHNPASQCGHGFRDSPHRPKSTQIQQGMGARRRTFAELTSSAKTPSRTSGC